MKIIDYKTIGIISYPNDLSKATKKLDFYFAKKELREASQLLPFPYNLAIQNLHNEKMFVLVIINW